MANPTKPLGTNTFPDALAALTTAKILDLTLKAFVAALLPLRAFSTVISGEVLRGIKKVEVPYYPAEAAAAIDFVAANGDCYDVGNTDLDKREVTVNKRKYLPWGLTSEEALSNGYLANLNFAQQKGRRLAEAMLSDVLSPLAVAANYPGNIIVGSASTFDADEALTIREKCNLAHMPRSNRSMIIEEAYETGLLRYLKPVSVSGDADALREGEVKRIAGFDEYATESLPTANNLVGVAIYPSALLVAMRPLEPLDSIKAVLTDYQVLTDPETGITLTYRKWPDPGCDREQEIVEVNYGYAVGEAAACQRLLSA